MSEQQVREYFAGYDETAEPPLPDGYAEASAERGRRRVRRRRTLAGAVTTGVAAVAALAVGVTVAGTGSTTQRPTLTAAMVLHRAALAADDQPVPRDDQFTYYKIKDSGDGPSDRATIELWLSVDGSKNGLMIVHQGGHTRRETLRPGDSGGWDIPSYQDLTKLPTDPDKLLAYFVGKQSGTGYACKGKPTEPPQKATNCQRTGAKQEAFYQMGWILDFEGGLMPPDLGAAIYNAATKVPGVTVDRDAVDAAGRHGIGVGLVYQGMGDEWVFDPKTYELLGTDGYYVTTTGGKSPLNSAVLDAGVVDKVGQEPH